MSVRNKDGSWTIRGDEFIADPLKWMSAVDHVDCPRVDVVTDDGLWILSICQRMETIDPEPTKE